MEVIVIHYKIVACDCSVEDMLLEDIKEEHLNTVSDWRKKHIKYRLFIELLSYVFVLYIMTKTSGLIFQATDNEMLLFGLIFMTLEVMFILVSICSKLKFLRRFKKLQYGIVNDKYTVKHGKRRRFRCYASVCFNINSRNLDNVRIVGRDSIKVRKGDEVIVVSFNNRKAYIIPLCD